ncbi:MAG: hypothetical protein J6Y30_13910 [Treponema sp.]|nr:hypothetical protein [Treponema sp.]
MKKILAITAMAAFAAVSFAEGITFGAWMRVLAAPVANNGDETITAASNSWGGAPRAARLNVTAVAPDGNAGFNYGIFSSEKGDNSISFDGPDEANLWVKPIDMVKVSYGNFDNNTLRGDVCYGSWNWMRPNAWIAGDEGLLMSGFGDTGLMVEVTPMENLYVQAVVPIIDANVKAGQTYKNLRGGFAYTVPGLVKVKGQYIGNGAASEDAFYTLNDEKISDADMAAALADALADDTNDADSDGTVSAAEAEAALEAAGYGISPKTDGNSNCALEAEIDILAVEGLYAGVGFRYDVVKDAKDNDPTHQKMKVALGASYQVMPELKVSASGAFFTYYNNDAMKPRFQAGVGVDYDLGDGLAANADFRYMSPEKDKDGKKDNTDRMAFSVGVTKNVSSNGYIGVAFQGVTNSGSLGGVAGVPNDKGENKNFVWAIPVALSVWF